MKKMLKIISVFCIACIVISMSALVSQATATSTMSCKTSLNVGDTLSVTVKFVAGTEDNEIYGVEGTLLYNTSVLSFVSCSEVATVKDSGITFSGSGSGSASKTVTFNFKAISLGNSYTRTLADITETMAPII